MYSFRSVNFLVGVGLVCSCMLPASASDEEKINQECYTNLVALLKSEISDLKSITDASSASLKIDSIKKNKDKQKELNHLQPDEQSFSIYVLRTDARKTEINFLLMSLARERQRLRQSDCFGQESLRALLGS